MKEYNGHRSWNAWNVSLWLNNDESLYHFCKTMKDEYGTRAVTRILEALPSKTPDGAKYNRLSVKLAIADM